MGVSAYCNLARRRQSTRCWRETTGQGGTHADQFVNAVSALAGFNGKLLIDFDVSRASDARYWQGAFKRLAAFQDCLG